LKIKNEATMSHKKEMIGVRYNSLVPREEVEKNMLERDPRTRYLCDCDCGHVNCRKTIITIGKRIRNGGTKTCGAREHGHNNVDTVRMATYLYIYRGLYDDGDLKVENFISISKLNCFYCGLEPSNKANSFKRAAKRLFSYQNGEVIYSGLDRINSMEPHNVGNVVPCCIQCNKFKLSRSYEELLVAIDGLKDNFIPTYVSEMELVHPNDPAIKAKIKNFLSHKREDKVSHGLSKYHLATLMVANCTYCHSDGQKKLNEVDRYENFDLDGIKTSYYPENCVPSCHHCNSAKQQLTPEEFRAWIVRIKTNLHNLPATSELLKKYLKTKEDLKC